VVAGMHNATDVFLWLLKPGFGAKPGRRKPGDRIKLAENIGGFCACPATNVCMRKGKWFCTWFKFVCKEQAV
jgi:hypothetical protein